MNYQVIRLGIVKFLNLFSSLKRRAERMPADHVEDKAPSQEKSNGPPGQHLLTGFKDYIYCLWARIQGLRIPIFIKLANLKDYIHRFWVWIKKLIIPIFAKLTGKHYPERRSGRERKIIQERRSGQKGLRIPIFIKLAGLSTLLIFLVITTISFSMLNRQKKQFIDQLINLGESMVHIIASNAPDKLLGEEDLSLFRLVNDIAQNDQVIYALITDEKNIIKAHSSIEEVNKAYSPPKNIIFLKEIGKVKVGSFIHGGEEILFFEKTITYHKVKVGKVCLAISQKKILQDIHGAKIFIVALTLTIIILGILLSLGLSRYFSSPIIKLRESAEALGMGDFDHRVIIKRNDELGDLGSAFNRMAKDLSLKDKIKASFGRYVTPEIVDMVLANPDSQWMKGSRVEATVLFVDIRDFTNLSEDKEPESIVELLNDFFTRVTDVIIEHGGYLNKFVGDEAMAVFGTPVPNPEHAEAAVRAALDIQKEIAKMVDLGKGMENLAIHVGIGINSGEMVAGNLGSQKRVEYTVIGDNVNVAARLTSLAKRSEILISKRTYDLIKEIKSLKVEERGKVSLKGRKKEITVFNLLVLE